jgi:hypothetical protein
MVLLQITGTEGRIVRRAAFQCPAGTARQQCKTDCQLEMLIDAHSQVIGGTLVEAASEVKGACAVIEDFTGIGGGVHCWVDLRAS